MKHITSVIALLLVLVSSSAFAEINRELSQQTEHNNSDYQSDYYCGAETQLGISFNYCIRNVDRTKNQDIVYFFHGLMGDEQSWFTQKFGTGMVERKWHFRGYDPTVITISFGEVWLLVNNHRFPLLPYFKNIIVPLLEKKVGGLGKGRRMLIGQSMGGLNAIEAALQLPNLFSKVALLCPAITTVGPFASQSEIDAYVQRTGAKAKNVKLMLNISRKVFINQNDWDKHDPLKLISRYHGRKPEFYNSIGMQDDFGFQEGAEQFSKLAKKSDFKSQWVPLQGGHCNFDRRTTANFIMEGYKND